MYATKYYYEIEKWVHKNDYKTNGKNHEPKWYEYNCNDKERERDKTGVYKVIVKNEKGKTKTYEFSYSEWAELKEGQTVKIKVHINGEAEIVK